MTRRCSPNPARRRLRPQPTASAADAVAPYLDALDSEGPIDFPRGDALADIDGSGEELIEDAGDERATAPCAGVDAGAEDAPEGTT